MSRRRTLLALGAAALVAACAALAPRPLPPKVEVEAVRLAIGPAGEPRLGVRLAVDNPNAYAVSIQSIDAELRVEDVPVATAFLPAPVTLVASGRTRVDVEARPDPAALRPVMERMLRSLRAGYEVTGSAVIQSGVRLDFHRRGELPLADLLGRLR
jgi:LEA14-like dessication related protein